MRRQFCLEGLYQGLTAEPLEQRILLDSALGDGFAQFASEQELQSLLVDQAVQRYEGTFGETIQSPWHHRCFDCFWGVEDVAFNFDAVSGLSPPRAGGVTVAGPDFSETNTQVEGVDEGDVIETDGEYVYVLSDNEVSIIDIRTAEHPRVASQFDLPEIGHGSEIYLSGDRLTVVSNVWGRSDGAWWPGPIDYYYGGQQQVIATVFDVTDREEPWLVKRTELDGSLTGSRTIDGNTYLMVQQSLDYPPPLIYPEMGEDKTSVMRPRYRYESESDYRARIEPFIVDVLPQYSTFDADGNEVSSGLIGNATDIYQAEGPIAATALSIVTVDMHVDESELKSTTTVLAARGHEVFMSLDSLYLFQPTWNRTDETEIVKFALDRDGSVEPVAQGTVPGRMLNQFSADEMHHQLRIATTSGRGRNSTNGVYILNQEDTDLEIVGSVEDMAPGETIFAVRFMNYRGYVVTFERVDPLFSLDLTVPTDPKIEDELKITGFSEQLIPLGETHLLGIGRDANENTGRVGNIQISLFDVSDPAALELSDRYTFRGGRYMSSPAEHDHHAIGYYPEANILAIPVSRTLRNARWAEQNGERVWIPPAVDNAMHVFRVDPSIGIESLGSVEHPSEVLRSVRIGEALISTSRDTLRITQLEDPDEIIGQVHFRPLTPTGRDKPVPLTPIDIDELFDGIARGAMESEFDSDGNGLINHDDVDFFVRAVLDTEYGDADLDGQVDFDDFAILAANFGDEGGWADGDFDGDGKVDFNDFTLLSANFG